MDGNAFGDRADHRDLRINRFENRVRCKRWWHEDHGRVSACLIDRFLDGVKHWQTCSRLATFARRNAADHFSAIF